MFTLHQSLHTQYGICLWTLLALVVFAIMLVIFIVHVVKQSKRKHDFEEELASKAEIKDNTEVQEG